MGTARVRVAVAAGFGTVFFRADLPAVVFFAAVFLTGDFFFTVLRTAFFAFFVVADRAVVFPRDLLAVFLAIDALSDWVPRCQSAAVGGATVSAGRTAGTLHDPQQS